MFVILLHYKKPLAEVDRWLVAHREFLEVGYQKNLFIASGPREPRTGGVILSQCHDRALLERELSQDPFQQQGIAEYEIIEFTPVKHHPQFTPFLTA